MPILFAIFVEAFISVHMSLFVLSPLSKIISQDNSKKVFWILFGIRVVILLVFDIFISTSIVIFDFFAVFIGALIIVPISAKITGTPISYSNSSIPRNTITNNLDDNNVEIVKDTSPIVAFDNTYYGNEKKILKNMITEEFKNHGDNVKTLTTSKLNKNKNILLLVFGLLTFINVLLYYFNYSILFCGFIEIILFITYFVINNKFSTLNVLANMAIKSPDEDIEKLINNIKAEKQDTLIPNFLKIVIVIFFALFIPTTIFYNPKVIYTRYGDGYQVFRYTRGITSNEESNFTRNYWKY